MLRIISAGFVVLCLAFGANAVALAETVRDTAHNFRVTVPSGWKSEANPSDDIRLFMTSSKAEQTGGSCNVVSEAHPKSSTLTQSAIEGELDQELNDAAWLAMFKSVIFIDNVAIEKTGSERINGHKAYYVIATFDSVTPGSPIIPVKLKQYLHAIPGEVFFVTCSAAHDGYAVEEDNFNSVFASFAPLNDTVAAAEPNGVPSLTLYAGANFGGVSRVVTQDTPDLALAGWREKAGSMSVAGPGLWQVCDGPNYAGTCRVVSSVLHQNVKAASARRLSPAQSNFALLLQAGGAQSTGAVLRKR
jgi:hypothetical protein